MEFNPKLRTVNVTRYILPLREGGSLPALADADDGFKYVLKFRGAGQREKALIAELLGGEIARLLGFKIPELVYANLDPAFGRSEGDEEIQDLLKGSQGLNLALHFLSGAINFDPIAMPVDPILASKIVWLDMYITNVDRTFRNTNMLMWNRELWLIDHGASFLFHHAWINWEKNAQGSFPIIKNHVLLEAASKLDQVNEEFKTLLTPAAIDKIVSLIPEEWLMAGGDTEEASEARKVYADFLKLRLSYSDEFTKEARNARSTLI
ncbi:aminotransferase class I and II [Algoriphagus halophytocola]|uniref:Aminotransferase class I and II n=1 Tax=Algoriphagus halophytocola TaxID=2991499 RepID=A0ABY6MIA0_9BACT|nr:MULTISPECIES: HipA family kinase [unclassified Algoriphagus]UZD21909.1 aminotransferase class I and II [Algoriphagus sp. TR-M5]WBL43159.1 aminotransferase class I and II [Algoriphagus sp. TR-M9]